MSKKILEELKDAIVIGNIRKVKRIADLIVNQGIPINTALNALTRAMKIVDERYRRKEFFITDVASSASAMRYAFKIFEPYLEVGPNMQKKKFVLGSLKGNTQGIGKDIVAATLTAGGFKVIDLGVDVTPQDFIKSAIQEKATLIGISVSLQETVPSLKEIMELLRKEGLEGKIKVIIGGTAASEDIKEDYSFDAYAKDAQDCLEKAKALLH